MQENMRTKYVIEKQQTEDSHKLFTLIWIEGASNKLTLLHYSSNAILNLYSVGATLVKVVRSPDVVFKLGSKN